MNSQKDWVIKQLINKGKISRNFALTNYISRLGAIIYTLKEEGWDFETYTLDTKKPNGQVGKNFVYEVKKCPLQMITYKVGDKVITHYK